MKLLLASGIALLYAALQMPSQPPMKMGLWEITTITQIQMPDIPSMPGMGPRTTKAHACLTKESYEKTFAQQAQQNKNCSINNQNWSGNTYSFDMSCGKMTGHFEGVFDSPTSGHSKTHMATTEGHNIIIDGTSTSMFLSDDCGGVTPDKPQIVR